MIALILKDGTEKYEQEKENYRLPIYFYPNRKIPHGEKRKFNGGYLFLQSIYYQLNLDQICRKIRTRHDYKYDLNAILSDLIYTRILDPGSKLSSFKAAKTFLEAPKYELHDIYRALSVIAQECTFIQAEVYKNSCEMMKRNSGILYYDCTNYYFEIEQEDDNRQYGKSKENRPNPIIQMGLFTDGDGVPLAFSLFPGKQNEQKSLAPLEKKVIEDFGCKQFIYCSDAGLASENNRMLNHTGKRAFIVTQSIKKLSSEYKTLALNKKGFRRLSDNKLVDIDNLSDSDYDQVFYKEEPYSSKKLEQRLIITYSPKYAAYQKNLSSEVLSKLRTDKLPYSGIKLIIPIKKSTIVDYKESFDNKQLRLTLTTPKETEIKTTKPIPAIIKKNPNVRTIIVDAGHGGSDVGATRENIYEKDITLDIAKRLEKILDKKGYNVVMTRSNDKYVSLQERVEITDKNEADLFVSVHVNSSVTPEGNGLETHYYTPQSYEFAQIVHKEFASAIDSKDRGLFKSKFYVINHTQCPSILVETGFISNPEERKELMTNQRRQKTAEAIAKGIVKYLDKN